MDYASWVWIPIVLGAAAAQTLRNASQRSLVKAAGTLPATFVRFGYGLPFAVIALIVVAAIDPRPLPEPNLPFFGWLVVGAFSQLAATAFLIKAMESRSFVVVVAYSKTEILQIGLFSVVLLGDPLTMASIFAIVLATVGVLLLSINPGERGEGLASWLSPSATLGLASGASFAMSAIGYRGAALALGPELPWVAAIFSLTLALTMQTLALGGYLWMKDRRGLLAVARAWRISTLAGFMGALASMLWLTAFAMRSAVDVRIVGLAEVLYSYVITRRFFGEAVSWREIAGIALVAAGIVVVSLAGR